MQRNYFICSMLGYHVAKNQAITGENLKILIDQDLIKSHFTPLGSEENDNELLGELINEVSMSVIARGFNRKHRRKT